MSNAGKFESSLNNFKSTSAAVEELKKKVEAIGIGTFHITFLKYIGINPFICGKLKVIELNDIFPTNPSPTYFVPIRT